MSESYEHCMECDSLTGRAGRAEDSLYHGYIGPFCEDCFEDWPDEQVAQIAALRQQLATTQAENEALRAQIKETEAKGRVLMDISRDLKARVAELESTLESYEALRRMHRLENYPNELAARGWLLRKQAEAVEKAAKRCIPKGLSLSSILDYAQRLRQQADEADRAGGE